MKVEMEVYQARARGFLILNVKTVGDAIAAATGMAKHHEIPMEPVEDGVVVRVVKIVK